MCGELTTADAGRRVQLCGWVARRRDHGEHLAFVDLRDHTGIVQCVVDGHVDVRSEWVLFVEGTVRARPEGTVNAELATGEIELVECAVEVLAGAEPPPFPVDDRAETDEVGPIALPLRGPAAAADAAQPAAAGARHRRHAGGHGAPGILRGRDAAAVDTDAGGVTRVRGAVAAAPRRFLRPAPEPADRQAAPDGGGDGPLLPGGQLPARRGPAGRPAVRIHPARHRGVVRDPGGRAGGRDRGRGRRHRGGRGRGARRGRADHVARRHEPVRDRQARSSLRPGARRSERRLRRHRRAGLCRAVREGAARPRGGVVRPEPSGRAGRPGQGARGEGTGLVQGDVGRAADGRQSPGQIPGRPRTGGPGERDRCRRR